MLAPSQRTRVAWCERVTYVMGILGNRDQPWNIDRDAASLYAPTRIE
jgi:hypothetical protein